MKHVKFIFITMIVLSISNILLGQTEKTPKETFIVTSRAGSFEAEEAISAVSDADMDMYRLRSLHRKLVFDNGVVIELFSAIEIKSLGFDINIENYSENLPEGYQEPIYSIAPNGNLMQFHKSLPTK